MNSNTFRLIGKIKGLSEEIRHINSKRGKNRGEQGHLTESWWKQKIKNDLGIDARHYLLAHSFIKNIAHGKQPYSRIEKKSLTKPSVERIVRICMDHNPISCTWSNSLGKRIYSVSWYTEEKFTQKVTAWLAGELE